MADQTRQGEDWNPFELDAIIADYFAMLGEELTKRPYVKAHHRAVLMQQTGRSAASIEFKHRNISAVLQELGLAWIWGYKPAPNYQDALFEAVDRYLSGHREAVEQQPTPVAPTVIVPDDVFTAMPASAPRPRRARLERLFERHPSLAYDLTWIAAHEERILDEHLLSIGRRSALERTAYLLSFIHQRAAAAGLNGGSRLLPITQQHVADTLGLSLVHTNKTLRRLADRKLTLWRERGCEVLDPEGLLALSGWEGLSKTPRPFI